MHPVSCRTTPPRGEEILGKEFRCRPDLGERLVHKIGEYRCRQNSHRKVYEMNAVIQGSFADYRRVKTRSVMQLIIEVPIEQGIQAVGVLGEPVPGTEIPVAIARLVPGAGTSSDSPIKTSLPEAGDRAKNYTAAAKLLAKDKSFHAFINGSTSMPDATSDEYIEQCIEGHCDVNSCSQIKDGTEAGRKFARLYAEFQEWQRFNP